MPVDKRKYVKRLAISAKIKVYRVDKATTRVLDAYLFEAKDMTQKGLFLKTPKTFPVGAKLKLELTLCPNKPAISVEGKVAWIAKRSQIGYYPGMGVSIIKVKRGEGKKIRDFIRQKLRNYRQAVELKKMYMQLKEMGGRLYDMEQAHPHAESFRKAIDNTIKEIDHIAHVIDREVWEIKSL